MKWKVLEIHYIKYFIFSVPILKVIPVNTWLTNLLIKILLTNHKTLPTFLSNPVVAKSNFVQSNVKSNKMFQLQYEFESRLTYIDI